MITRILLSRSGEGLGVRVARRGSQGLTNPREDQVEVGVNFVAEPNDVQAEPFQDFSATGVVVGKPIMLLAVYVNDECGRVTIEIEDILIEGKLPFDFRTARRLFCKVGIENEF